MICDIAEVAEDLSGATDCPTQQWNKNQELVILLDIEISIFDIFYAQLKQTVENIVTL